MTQSDKIANFKCNKNKTFVGILAYLTHLSNLNSKRAKYFDESNLSITNKFPELPANYKKLANLIITSYN